MKKANASDTQKVLDATSAGEPIPSGFSYAPHHVDGPVFELDAADHENLQNGVEVSPPARQGSTPEQTPATTTTPAPKTVGGEEKKGS